MTIVLCAIILILCAGCLGFFFSEDRLFAAFWAMAITFGIFVNVGIVVVAVHFIGKYW